MTKNGWTLFQELLAQEIALGLLPPPPDYFGATLPLADPDLLDTEEYTPDWDTKRISVVDIEEGQ